MAQTLKEVLREKIEAHRPRTTRLVKKFGDVKLGEVTVGQAIGGARGVKMLVTDISYLDPMEGIRFRGKTIPETMEMLPKYPGSEYPSVEAFFFFLMTGEVPNAEQVEEVMTTFRENRHLPQSVIDLLRSFPENAHPMTMFSAGILAMQPDSVFAAKYREGMSKMDYWEPMLEDVMNLVSKLPTLAAYIYRLKYRNDEHIAADDSLDMGGNFAHMMGIPAPYDDVARMYFIIHSDHESGNVSAHATHLVASALSDAYYALSAGINGLAGPLHGLATQEVLRWTLEFQEGLKGQEPTKELIHKALWATLNKGQVIPGYGHAVLRRTDPRYMAQREFCQKHMPEDKLFQLISAIYDVAPGVLVEQGKAKNPWPNVDAQSGVIQRYYGLTEVDFYTVLFGVGRALGVLTNIVWDRALGYSIERPKSVSTAMLEELVGVK